MGTINDKLNRVLATKNGIRSALINKGITVNDSDTFNSYVQKIEDYNGIDTSDATATANDIVKGVTAYVNGEKITGEVKLLANSEEEVEGTRIGNQGKVKLFESEDTTVVTIIEQTTERMAFEKDSFIATGVSYDKMSTAIGLTPDKLKFGEKVLDINGEFTSDATATAEDIAKDKTAYVNGEKVVGIAGPSEYFSNTIGAGEITSSNKKSGLISTIIKAPDNFFNIEGTDCSAMFYETNIEVAPMMDTGKVTNMEKMFYSCTQLTSVPQYNTNMVNNMRYMFYQCNQLTNVPLFDTSNVTDISDMLNGCNQLTSVPMFDTSNVTDISNMLMSCKQLTSVPMFNTSKVTNIEYMLYGCTQLTSVPSFDTSNVTKMDYMLYGCTQLTSVPEFDASKVKNINGVIFNCTQINSLGGFIDLGKAYTEKTTNYTYYVLHIMSDYVTHDSLMNVINKLYDLNLNTNLSVDGVCQYTQSLYIGSTNIAKLTEEEIAIATAKGWTVS